MHTETKTRAIQKKNGSLKQFWEKNKYIFFVTNTQKTVCAEIHDVSHTDIRPCLLKTITKKSPRVIFACITRHLRFNVTFRPVNYLHNIIPGKKKQSYSWNLPLRFDVSARADVILGGEHKLVVKHPLRLVVQHSGGVQLYDLVVFHRQVVARALQVSDLFTPQREKTVK